MPKVNKVFKTVKRTLLSKRFKLILIVGGSVIIFLFVVPSCASACEWIKKIRKGSMW